MLSRLTVAFIAVAIVLHVGLSAGKNSNKGKDSKEKDDKPIPREVCLKYICPYVLVPSCNCPNSQLPTWNRKKRSTRSLLKLLTKPGSEHPGE